MSLLNWLFPLGSSRMVLLEVLQKEIEMYSMFPPGTSKHIVAHDTVTWSGHHFVTFFLYGEKIAFSYMSDHGIVLVFIYNFKGE